MTRPGLITITPVSPSGDPRKFLLGTSVPMPTDGKGGWTEVQRPRRTSLTEFTGAAAPKVDVTIMLDGYPDTSIEADLKWLEALGTLAVAQSQTPTFIINGPVYLAGKKLICAAMSWGQFERRVSDGVIVRQELTMTCWQLITADILSSARKHQTQNGKQSHPKTYVVRAGDTLQKIAARFYGAATDWHKIADANGLRDPKHLKVGEKLTLP